MFDTPNGGFFYSYIVVLGHYSRVILYRILVLTSISEVYWNLLSSRAWLDTQKEWIMVDMEVADTHLRSVDYPQWLSHYFFTYSEVVL